jgi:quercetin dioxygenase-like cupin family protein
MALREFPAFVKKLPEIDVPLPGVRGWLIQGEKQQTVFVEFGETVEVPEHAHGDQWEFAVAGRAELHRAGGTETYEAGDNFFVPAGQPHAATVHAGYRAMMVFDDPARYRIREV